MKLKSDNRGVTLVELVIAVSLLTIVLSSAYAFLNFSSNSMEDTQAQFIAQEDAKRAFLSMEADIRTAQAANFAGVNHKAAEVPDDSSGMQLDVYTDIDEDGTPENVQYKLFGSTLKRGEAELGADPGGWIPLAGKVKNNLLTPKVVIFSISNETVNINLIITDEKDRLVDDPVSAVTSITVRSKEAMD